MTKAHLTSQEILKAKLPANHWWMNVAPIGQKPRWIAEPVEDAVNINGHLVKAPRRVLTDLKNSDGRPRAGGMQMSATDGAISRRPAHPKDTISGGPIGPSEHSCTLSSQNGTSHD